jgi:hypothetical protein
MADTKHRRGKFTLQLAIIVDITIHVITKPAVFFKSMPRGSGFADPAIFMMAIGLVVGIIQAILTIIGFGPTVPVSVTFFSILLTPIFVAMFGFVGAAILFLIWKPLGSEESFETAYRCGAYATAITPITTIVSLIPYIGSLAGLVWMMYLLVMASVHVHNLSRKKSLIVFGALCALLAVFTLSSQYAARNSECPPGAWQDGTGSTIENTLPDAAGKK